MRQAVDTSFAAAMQITLEPDEHDAHVVIIYGPMAVCNVLGRKALKVGTLHAGEVVAVFESSAGDMGVSLRTSLGWFSQIASNGRLAVEKLAGEDGACLSIVLCCFSIVLCCLSIVLCCFSSRFMLFLC